MAEDEDNAERFRQVGDRLSDEPAAASASSQAAAGDGSVAAGSTSPGRCSLPRRRRESRATFSAIRYSQAANDPVSQ